MSPSRSWLNQNRLLLSLEEIFFEFIETLLSVMKLTITTIVDDTHLYASETITASKKKVWSLVLRISIFVVAVIITFIAIII